LNAAQQIVDHLLEADVRRLIKAGLPRAQFVRKIRAALERLNWELVDVTPVEGSDHLLVEFIPRIRIYKNELASMSVDSMRDRVFREHAQRSLRSLLEKEFETRVIVSIPDLYGFRNQNTHTMAVTIIPWK
jgi:hypothetical protein